MDISTLGFMGAAVCIPRTKQPGLSPIHILEQCSCSRKQQQQLGIEPGTSQSAVQHSINEIVHDKCYQYYLTSIRVMI